MKRTLLPLLMCFAACTLPVAAQQSSLLSQAQRAYIAGDIPAAKALFEKVLAEEPGNVTARNYLKGILTAEAEAAKNAPGAVMEKQYKALILPKVEFKDATLDSVLEALRQMGIKASNGKLEPNFVLQPGVNPSAPVTLHLSNIPFIEALRYVGELVKADFVVDRYAIVVKPKAIPAPAVSEPTAPPPSPAQ